MKNLEPKFVLKKDTPGFKTGRNVIMDKEKLQTILNEHKLWLEDNTKGKRADLSYADLSNANLSNANLSNANLFNANLSNANLFNANLFNVNLCKADLFNANLCKADLFNANLSNANLSNTNLFNANLSNANLSQIKNSPFFNQYDWMCENFEKDREGFYVYKRIGFTSFIIPNNWIIKPGEFISDIVNMNRTNDCGCGVNFGTRKWCEKNYKNTDLWLCKLYFRDLCDLCVPIDTDGKARCGRLQLIRKVNSM